MSRISRKTLFILIFIALVIGVLGYFGITTSQTQESDNGDSQADTTAIETGTAANEETANSVGETQEEAAAGMDELLQISTEYGTLLYPSEWADSLVTEETEEDSSCRVTFCTVIDGTTYELFTVIIGEEAADGMGTLIGTDGTRRAVTIEASELDDLSALSEDQQDQIYAMQEALNIVTENLE